MKNTNTKKCKIIVDILLCVLLFFASICFFSARWYINTYGDIGFDSILYTLFSGLNGVQGGLVADFLLKALLPGSVLTAVCFLFLFFKPKKPLEFTLFKNTEKKVKLYPVNRIVAVVCSCVLSVALILNASIEVRLIDYLISNAQQTEIFEKDYVDPNKTKIEFPSNKRNLIYIYLESMESTYFSNEQGGALPYNAIPELYNMAKDNINFSTNENVGGFLTAAGTSWTMGALVAQTSGLPLKIPSNFASNTYGKETFLKKAPSITSVLHDNGYYQVLMFGSDAAFANRDRYFLDHNIDKIYDIYSARADGIVPKDYSVWWGMEDEHLYKYAKEVLAELASKEQPFSFTTLTADTHHIDGYKCSLCENKYTEQYENVMSCASRQAYEFIEWIKQQDFYENTTIVICGDHLTMDSAYINRNVSSGYERHVYNCFINSAVEPISSKNRIFTAMDMFPSTLAAMGCKIEGERLGLGTNMFSNTKTLPEEMGYNQFNSEISKNSGYYAMHFMTK